MDVDRPNKIRAVIRNARAERELIYDGKTVTLYTPAQKYYSTVEFAEPLGVLINRLKERFGVEVPLADLFLWGTPAAPLDYHPVATAAAVGAAVAVTSAVVGSMVRTVPPGCVPVNYGGVVYQQCGGTWYAPQGSQFVVVNPPY